ncbi:MAG TPA: SdpI family protein [Thermoanaerobaculia bacterium]|nr:SdpI family protein [Thermoanaerobaculia bacterium]
MTALTITFVAAGVLLIVVAIPMALRRVPPNGLYGLRVPATFASERVWYEANARSGRDLLCAGAGQIVLAVGLRAVPAIREGAYALINGGIMVVALLVLTVVGWRRANRLLAEERSQR